MPLGGKNQTYCIVLLQYLLVALVRPNEPILAPICYARISMRSPQESMGGQAGRLRAFPEYTRSAVHNAENASSKSSLEYCPAGKVDKAEEYALQYRGITRASRSVFPSADFLRYDMARFPFHAQKQTSGWTSRIHS